MMAEWPQWPGARISADGAYRYELTRAWGDGALALWIMLNPSTADATLDDPTIRRCIGFSQREGCGRLAVVNLFALRTTDPAGLLDHPDPVGPDNRRTLGEWFMRSNFYPGGITVAAWGAWRPGSVAAQRLAVESVANVARRPLLCLGITKAGAPRHPLYLASSTPLVPFPGAW